MTLINNTALPNPAMSINSPQLSQSTIHLTIEPNITNIKSEIINYLADVLHMSSHIRLALQLLLHSFVFRYLDLVLTINGFEQIVKQLKLVVTQ